MVVQVGTDPGQIMRDADAICGQMRGRPDARQHQDVRRADGTGGEDYVALRHRRACHAVAPVADACGAATVQHDTLDQRAGLDAQVRPRHGGAQERLGRLEADAAPLVDVQRADAFRCRRG